MKEEVDLRSAQVRQSRNQSEGAGAINILGTDTGYSNVTTLGQ
jgi:hypothetical protein